MTGKAILITGCGEGFGHHFAIKCAQEGMTVFAGCLSPISFSELNEKSVCLPGKMLPFKLDVTNQKTIDKSLELVESHLEKGQGLHALVNNAAILRAGFDDWISADDYEECLKVNTFGGIRVTEKFKHLIKKEQGRIVMVSSIAGRISLPGCGPYIVSKFAVEAYADTIRRELHQFGVKVALIEPGFHRTVVSEDGHWIDLFKKAWKRAPESVKEEYGGTDFLDKHNSLLGRLLNSSITSAHVDDVVDAYYEAISAEFPRNRYPVGRGARYFWIPLSNMPAFVQDPLLRWFYRKFETEVEAARRGDSCLKDELAK